MAGLGVLRSWAASEATPPRDVVLIDFADEEGSRFGRSLFGSSALSGTLVPEELAGSDGRRRRGDRRGPRRAMGSTSPAGTRAAEPHRHHRLVLRAAHRAGAGARGRGHDVQRRLRHGRGRTPPLRVRGTGLARGNDPDGPATRRRARRRRDGDRDRADRPRARRCRDDRPDRPRAGDRHRGRRPGTALGGPAPPRGRRRSRPMHEAALAAAGSAAERSRLRVRHEPRSGGSSRFPSTRGSSRSPSDRSRPSVGGKRPSQAVRCTMRPRWRDTYRP